MDFKVQLILTLLLIHKALGVDFSQFYLPPCCYTSSTAASSNINTRYEKPEAKTKSSGTIQLFVPKTSSNLEKHVNNDENKSSAQPSKKKTPTRTRLYRYIIPVGLEKREPRDSGSDEAITGESGELFRSAVSKNSHMHMRDTPVPIGKSEFQKSIEKLLSSAQIETELVKPSTKPLQGDRDYLKHRNDSDVLAKHKRNIQQLHGMNETMVAEHYDMPPNWVINLKRALFQSMDNMLTATQKSESPADEKLQAKSSNHNPFQGSSAESIRDRKRLSYLWPQIRAANFSYIEPLTKSGSSLPTNLLMPVGQGPIASGVVVNTVRGIELRMSSELHFQQDEPSTSASHLKLQETNEVGCNCPLINEGEMLLAYWSVSRILNELGQNSLQYLIYPLPHNVPTPPRVMQFNAIQFSNPSQQYPTQQVQPINQVSARNPGPSIHQNYDESPPFLAEAPEDDSNYQQNVLQNAQPNFPAQYEQVFQNLQQFSQLPPPRRPVDDRTNFRGVVAHHDAYDPDLGYGQTNGQQQFNPQAFASPLPHPNFIPIGHPLGQTLATAAPTPAQFPQASLPGNYRQNVNRKPTTPSHITLFDGGNPQHPKSIQDLLTPYPQNVGYTTQSTPSIGAVPSGLIPEDIPKNIQQPLGGSIYSLHQNEGQYEGVVNFANKQNQANPLLPQSPNKGLNINNYYSFADLQDHFINPAAELPHLPIDGNPNYHPVRIHHDRSREENDRFVYQSRQQFGSHLDGRKDFSDRPPRPFYPSHQQDPVPINSFVRGNDDRRSYYDRQNHPRHTPVAHQRSDRYIGTSATRKPPTDNRGYIIDF